MPRSCPSLSKLTRRDICVLLALPALGMDSVRAGQDTLLTMGFYLPVIRDVPRKDVDVTLRFWLEELASAANVKLGPVQFYDDMKVMKGDVVAGKVDLIVGTAMGIAHYFSDGDLSEGATGYKVVNDDLLMLVRKDGGIRTTADLAGKRLVLLEGDELSEIYFETLMMKIWGAPDWGRLGAVIREARSNKVTHRLFFNTADVALIYRNSYEAAAALNPQIGDTLLVLDAYTFKTRSPMIALFSSHVSSEKRELFIKGALAINNSARGRQVLQLYQSTVMERSFVSELSPYRALLASHHALKAAAAAATVKKRAK